MTEGFGEQARDFAKRYVALVDALRSEGVLEGVAREEARAAAVMLMYQRLPEEDPDNEFCPLCGHQREED